MQLKLLMLDFIGVLDAPKPTSLRLRAISRTSTLHHNQLWRSNGEASFSSITSLLPRKMLVPTRGEVRADGVDTVDRDAA